jgi:hypothetical protein
MPIYMRWGWDAVTGSVSADGYKSWIEVASIKLADQNLTEYTRKKPNSLVLRIADPKVALVFFRMAAGRERPTQRVTIVVVKPNSNEETLHLELADVVVTGANMDGQSVAVTLMFLSSISVRRPNPVHAPTGWDIFP